MIRICAFEAAIRQERTTSSNNYNKYYIECYAIHINVWYECVSSDSIQGRVAMVVSLMHGYGWRYRRKIRALSILNCEC